MVGSKVTETVLVVFGALLGAMVGLFVKAPLPITYLSLFLPIALVLLFVGVGGPSWLQHKWYIKTRCGSRSPLRRKVPKIGILDDLGWNAKNIGQIATYTNISPKKWQSVIKWRARKHELPVEVELIKVNQNLDPYIMVLNPYGGVYPEYDLETDVTFTKVLRYVKSGGVFINVADVPGFWAYPLEERKQRRPVGRIESADPKAEPFQSRLSTPLLDKLGIPMYGGKSFEWEVEFEEPLCTDFKDQLTVQVDRGAQTTWETGTGSESIVAPIVKLKKFNNNKFKGREVTPTFMVDYGKGEFFVSTIPLCFPNNPETVCKIIEIIADLIVTTAENLCSRPTHRSPFRDPDQCHPIREDHRKGRTHPASPTPTPEG